MFKLRYYYSFWKMNMQKLLLICILKKYILNMLNFLFLHI